MFTACHYEFYSNTINANPLKINFEQCAKVLNHKRGIGDLKGPEGVFDDDINSDIKLANSIVEDYGKRAVDKGKKEKKLAMKVKIR